MNLEGEYKCGYYISPEQKRINAVYLDLLNTFDSLCARAGLTYWLYGGALIGAVRHKGFIPWDDDVDLIMPRADFDRLQAMTNADFGAGTPYFLQNFTTDPGCAQSLIRFRRSDTADIRDYDLSYARSHPGQPPYNMGINLAVFPLDSLPESAFVRKLQAKAAYALRGVFYRAILPDPAKPAQHALCAMICRVLGEMNMMKLIHWLYRAPKRVCADRLQSFDGLYDCGLIWSSKLFRETVLLPFEDILVPAPVGYHEFLTVTYGDYMQLPPEEKRVAPHDGHTDPAAPYPAVLEALLSGKDPADGRAEA